MDAAWTKWRRGNRSWPPSHQARFLTGCRRIRWVDRAEPATPGAVRDVSAEEYREQECLGRVDRWLQFGRPFAVSPEFRVHHLPTFRPTIGNLSGNCCGRVRKRRGAGPVLGWLTKALVEKLNPRSDYSERVAALARPKGPFVALVRIRWGQSGRCEGARPLPDQALYIEMSDCEIAVNGGNYGFSGEAADALRLGPCALDRPPAFFANTVEYHRRESLHHKVGFARVQGRGNRSSA